jgi:L-lysine exporter family protein LysE/ArgO
MKPAWTGFLLCLSLCLDLGIVNIATLRTSLDQGGTAGFLIGLGACAGDLVYFALAAFGATALLSWAPFRWSLWAFGTCVLALLAWRMAREAIRPHRLDLKEGSVPERKSAGGLIAAGAGLALASPTSILWFAAVGGSVIASFGGNRSVLWPFAAGFVAAGLLWAAVFSYAAASLRHLGTQFVRVLSLISAVLFVYFAVTVFMSGLRQMR